MLWYIIVIVVFLIIVGLLKVANFPLEKQNKSSLNPDEYRPRDVLTETEKKFFKNLVQGIPNTMTVFAQVPFSCIVQTRNRQDSTAFRKINQKRVDFIILDENLKSLCIVELDDWTHKNKKQQDDERDDLFSKNGLPTIRFNVKDNNNADQIKERLILEFEPKKI